MFPHLAVWYWNCRQERNFNTTYIQGKPVSAFGILWWTFSCMNIMQISKVSFSNEPKCTKLSSPGSSAILSTSMMGLRPDKKRPCLVQMINSSVDIFFGGQVKKNGRWRIHSLWSVQIPMIKHRGKQVVLVSKHIHYICIALFNALCLVPGLSMLMIT